VFLSFKASGVMKEKLAFKRAFATGWHVEVKVGGVDAGQMPASTRWSLLTGSNNSHTHNNWLRKSSFYASVRSYQLVACFWA